MYFVIRSLALGFILASLVHVFLRSTFRRDWLLSFARSVLSIVKSIRMVLRSSDNLHLGIILIFIAVVLTRAEKTVSTTLDEEQLWLQLIEALAAHEVAAGSVAEGIKAHHERSCPAIAVSGGAPVGERLDRSAAQIAAVGSPVIVVVVVPVVFFVVVAHVQFTV